MSVLLSLAASLLWGLSDFTAGFTSKRLRAAAVVGWSQAVSVLLLTILVIPKLADPVGTAWVPWAVLAGIGGATGLLLFYAALANGTMGVVAPIAGMGAALTVLLGVVIDGEQPSARAWVGMLLALAGTALAGGPEVRGGTHARPILLAMGAAVGFGVVFYGLHRGSVHSVWHTLWLERLVIVVIFAVLALSTRSLGGASRRDGPVLLLIGVADLVANGLYAWASTMGMVSIASVLGSLYPVWTTALAAAFLKERMRTVQWAGVALTMGGIATIGLG